MKSLKLQGEYLITGANSLDWFGQVEFRKCMIVTGGQSMFKNGSIDKLQSMLSKKGETVVYHGIEKNPTANCVLKGLEKMKEFAPDLVIAIGGGSAIDAAKAMILFYEFENLNFDNVFTTPLPQKRTKTTFAVVPSTSGTASEVTHVSVITFVDKQLKLAIKTEAIRPDIAILDGTICMSMPKNIAAETGLDALTHAIEAFTNKNSDAFTSALAKEAIEGIFKSLYESVCQGTLKSRQDMHDYSCMAGMAFSNSGLGMVHGISHAFSGIFNTSHGLSNAVILPYVLEYNSADPWVKERLDILSYAIKCDVIEAVISLKKDLEIATCMQETGISQEEYQEKYAEILSASMLGSTAVNPILMTVEQMEFVLKKVFYGN